MSRSRGGEGVLPSLVRAAWVLCEDPEYRAALAVALDSAGYGDVVAFEDAEQLLAHRPSCPPLLAVVESRTARFDARDIHRALSGIPLVVMVATDEQGELWRSLGVEHLLHRPPSTRTPRVSGFALCEGAAAARPVCAGRRVVEADEGSIDRPGNDPEGESSVCVKSLEHLLGRFGSSVPLEPTLRK